MRMTAHYGWTTSALEFGRPSACPRLCTCLKSRRPPFGGPRRACVVTASSEWSGKRDSNPRQPAWKDQDLSAGDERWQAPRIVNQRVVAMAVGWAPNRLKVGPNGSGVNRLDTDDILAPHTPPKAPSNGSDCVFGCARDKGPNRLGDRGPRRAEIAVLRAE